MASGSHDMVFRDVRFGNARAGLRDIRSAFSRAVQLVLSRSGRQACAARARPAFATRSYDRAQVSRACRPCDAGSFRPGARAGLSRTDRARPQSRAAASRTGSDGSQASVLAQSNAPFVPITLATPASEPGCAGVASLRARADVDRTPRRWLRFRQRRTRPSSIRRAVRARVASDRKSTRLNSSHVEISYAV